MARFIKSAFGSLAVANLAAYLLLLLCVALWGNGAAAWFGVAWPWPLPWTLFSYMFTQSSAVNLLFNLLWLWCFSRLFLEVSVPRRMLLAYVTGGVCGALFFLAAAAAGLCGGVLFGSSAAVLSIICCGAAMAPRWRFNLMFFGAVEMRWIAVVSVALSLLGFAMGNAGGAVAHIGGSLGGYVLGLVFSRRRFRARKWTAPTPEPKSKSDSETLDELLDKVRRSGYASLTPEEQKRLFEISKKL